MNNQTIIFTGPPASGKTSLVNALQCDNISMSIFNEPKHRKSFIRLSTLPQIVVFDECGPGTDWEKIARLTKEGFRLDKGFWFPKIICICQEVPVIPKELAGWFIIFKISH